MAIDALDYITIEGFKSIAAVKELELRPINVLIGPNGSGKSNFIGVFEFLHFIREGRLRNYVTKAGGAEKILHFGSKTTNEIHFHLSFENKAKRYGLRLAPTEDDGLFPIEETASLRTKGSRRTYSVPLVPVNNGREAGISVQAPEPFVALVRQRLGRWRLYHFHDTSSLSPMRKTAKVDDDEFLRADGSNLAAFLHFLRENHMDSYHLIRGAVHRVAPFFEDFTLDPLRRAPDNIKLEWRHVDTDQYFDASSLSDGTLRFIVLATLFLQPKEYRPSLILVDEPELGLHPFAIEILASLVRQAAVETHVILSTQSSLLLDHFDPEDVLVADRVEGATQITRPDPERLKQWLKNYSLGQLWEKNELGGRPVPA